MGRTGGNRICLVHAPLVPTAVIDADVFVAHKVGNEERLTRTPARAAIEADLIVRFNIPRSPDNGSRLHTHSLRKVYLC